MSLLLVHDHLLSKRGIAAPVNHPLRLAIEKHKTRLQAELTKSRLRRRCTSIEDLRKHLQKHETALGCPQPRWTRVNNLKSTLSEQLSTTFAGYTQVPALADVISAGPVEKILHVDKHIPDLLALPPGTNLTKKQSYRHGEIILQDKASCFPAYFLLGDSVAHSQGAILDACAAPGNKTTHLASILSQRNCALASATPTKIFASERDSQRCKVLQQMLKLSASENLVTVLPNQDFLALDPNDVRFREVTHLLLDPSCSGSGIIGREDIPDLALPEDPRAKEDGVDGAAGLSDGNASKKRKRKRGGEEDVSQAAAELPKLPLAAENEGAVQPTDPIRLQKLSSLQVRIIEHAFSFPSATHITYSTCSINVLENEAVVAKALELPVAKERHWKVWSREEQPAGLRKWQYRGMRTKGVFMGIDVSSNEEPSHKPDESAGQLNERDTNACIRCVSGDREGTIGFFVCGFIRNSASNSEETLQARSVTAIKLPNCHSEDEWNGFEDP